MTQYSANAFILNSTDFFFTAVVYFESHEAATAEVARFPKSARVRLSQDKRGNRYEVCFQVKEVVSDGNIANESGMNRLRKFIEIAGRDNISVWGNSTTSLTADQIWAIANA